MKSLGSLAHFGHMYLAAGLKYLLVQAPDGLYKNFSRQHQEEERRTNVVSVCLRNFTLSSGTLMVGETDFLA